MMMRAKIPVEAGNVGLSEGALPAKLQQVIKLVEPEAVYIGTDGGVRCVQIFRWMVFELTSASSAVSVWVKPAARPLRMSSSLAFQSRFELDMLAAPGTGCSTGIS
jgi:hypothetical protein